MSEFINNVSKRQETLKTIIRSLHTGTSVEDAKKEFKKHFEDVTTAEITQMEQALIREGMKVEEVQKLCDVHASIFEGSISDIHTLSTSENAPGHPMKVLVDENERITTLINEEIKPFLTQQGDVPQLMLRVGYERLQQIDNHYKRKEYMIFPRLEKKGITAPPKVMWGVHDEIRGEMKRIIFDLGQKEFNLESNLEFINENIRKIEDMVVKENNILVPLLVDNLNLYDWILIDETSDEMGYFLEAPTQKFSDNAPEIEVEEVEEEVKTDLGAIQFGSGSLSQTEVNSLLNTLPLDMTFVDKDGFVKYFSQGKERIFDRPSTIIGRHVSLCHPPSSVHVVEEIVESFESGRKDNEDFWIRMKDMFVYIRYFAVRDTEGNFLGTLEITQNIKPITELQGEKRLTSK